MPLNPKQDQGADTTNKKYRGFHKKRYPQLEPNKPLKPKQKNHQVCNKKAHRTISNHFFKF